MYFQCFPGQNKNIYVVLMFMYLVQSGVLDEVHLDFMVPGHSFLPCDRGFGAIERLCRKKEIISCPEEYAEIISSIKNTKVHKLKQEEILDFKSLKDRITLRKAGEGHYFHKARRIILSKEHKYEYVMITEQGTCNVDLRKKKRKNPISSDPIRQKYPHGEALKVQPDKVKDVAHFRDYLDLRGKKWVQKVVVGQQSARNRHEPDQEEITHADNLQDDDQIIDYVSVTRLQDVDDLEAPEEEVLAVVMADSDDDMFAGDD